MRCNQLNEIIDTIREAGEYLKGSEKEYTDENLFLLNDIVGGIQSVNIQLFCDKKIKGYDMSALLDEIKQTRKMTRFLEKVTEWCEFVQNIIINRQVQANELDERFVWLMDYVQYVAKEDLIEHIKIRLMRLDKEHISLIDNFYQNHAYFWGTLDIKKGKYDVIYDRVEKLTEHRDDFIWLYRRLGDYRSKLVLVNTLYNWISFDPAYIRKMHENNFKDYYDLDLLFCDENEVVVDVGAYTGDSALDYITTYRRYKKIYCYEITPESVEKMKKTLADYENIDIVNKGLGSEAGKMFLQTCAQDSSTNGLDEAGNGIEIEVATLDEDVKEKVTLIKMDIEGAERDALLGAQNIIREQKPKLAVCLYHGYDELWSLPRLIEGITPEYEFYLRHYGDNIFPTEFVLLCR